MTAPCHTALSSIYRRAACPLCCAEAAWLVRGRWAVRTVYAAILRLREGGRLVPAGWAGATRRHGRQRSWAARQENKT